jgi:hypothetical protein
VRRGLWILLGVLLLGLAFVVGIAVGEALHDSPASGGTQSIVRTLEPLPLAPAAERTVTVTTTAP